MGGVAVTSRARRCRPLELTQEPFGGVASSAVHQGPIGNEAKRSAWRHIAAVDGNLVRLDGQPAGEHREQRSERCRPPADLDMEGLVELLEEPRSTYADLRMAARARLAGWPNRRSVA